MTSNVDKTKTVSKNLLEWLSIIGGISVVLFDFLSLFLDDKPAKQFSFGLAILFLLGTFWYQNRRNKDSRIPSIDKADSTIAASRLFKSYLSIYEQDRSLRIPIKQVRWIQKLVSNKVLKEKKAADLIRTSETTFYWTLGTNIFLGIILTTTLFALLITNYTFNPINYFFGHDIVQEENPFILLKNGNNDIMIFGSDTPDPGGREQKTQIIPIDNFRILQTEVTNRQYYICRSAGGCKSDPAYPKFYQDEIFANHPVVFVNVAQAKEFCHWMGGELPSSEEWERAARGLSGNLWPSWSGETFPLYRANLPILGVLDQGTVDVTRFSEDKTYEGVMGLVGNVSEWTNSRFVKKGNLFTTVPLDERDLQAETVIRGGSFTFAPTRITQIQYRGPDKGSESIGFRCIIPGDQ